MKKFMCLVIVVMLSVQTVFGESSFYKLNGGRGEAIVSDPYEELEIESIHSNESTGDIITYVDGSSMERPNSIIYSDNSTEFVGYSHKLLYLNGALVKNTEIEIINNTSYIDVDILDNMVDYSVNQNNDGTVVVNKGADSVLVKDVKNVNDNTYIPLRYTFENLNMNVSYYGVTDIKSVSLVPSRVSIYIDETYTNYESIDDALVNSKKICLEGLENYKNGIVENYNGEVNLDDEFLMIEQCINEMSYIGEVSRYYVFDMNLYRVVYDKVSGEVYFDYNTGLCTFVKLVDVNDRGLYAPLFIVG